MKPRSLAHPELERLGFSVELLPTADREQRKEADLLARIGDETLLIEEKTKEENPAHRTQRESAHDAGQLHTVTLPLTPNPTLSGVIGDAAAQLRSSARHAHDFRLIWFNATGPTAKGKAHQFSATVYGRTNIIEMGAAGFRRCYFFRNSEFYRRRDVLDGAIVATQQDGTLQTSLLLNPLSPRFTELRKAKSLRPFAGQVEDPTVLESRRTAFIVNSDLDRKDEQGLLQYLKLKYQTGPLMNMDMEFTQVSMRSE